jgi:hypothetical protein
MYCPSDTDDNERGLPEHEFTEEQFFEQFAALEDSLARLQIHMRDMSEHVKLFGSLVRQIRRSICPASLPPQREARARAGMPAGTKAQGGWSQARPTNG